MYVKKALYSKKRERNKESLVQTIQKYKERNPKFLLTNSVKPNGHAMPSLTQGSLCDPHFTSSSSVFFQQTRVLETNTLAAQMKPNDPSSHEI